MKRFWMRWLPLAPLLLVALAATTALSQEESLDPYEWTIETYAFPARELIFGFASEERGALRPPPLPGEDAGVEEIRAFIRQSSSVTVHYLETQGLSLPKGSLLVFDPESLTLAARLPRIAQSSVSFSADALTARVPKYLAFDHQVVEAPAKEMRALLAEHSGSADHTKFLRSLEEGNGETMSSMRIETRSGQRASLEQAESHAKPVELTIDEAEQASFVTEEVNEGTMLELDPVLGDDGSIIDLSISLEHHYAPAERRQEPLTQRSGKSVTMSVIDTWHARLTTAITMRNGTSQLLGVWRPTRYTGNEERDVLQAAFLTGDMVEVLPLPNPALAVLLEKHGDAVLAVPAGDPSFENEAEEIPEGMIVRRFRMPPDFLTRLGSGGGGAAVDDPFAPDVGFEPRFTIRATAQDVLASMGVDFPEGSSANYLAAKSILVVRNTPEQIRLLEAIVTDSLARAPKAIVITAHVVEAPTDLVRQAARESRPLANHENIWTEMQKAEGVKILSTNWITTRSGQRSKVVAGREHMHHVAASLGTPAAAGNKAHGSSITRETDVQHVGTQLEVDPVLGDDGVTIDLSFRLEYDYAPPSLEGQAVGDGGEQEIAVDARTTTFSEARLTTAATMRSGSIRMMGTWHPKKGGEKVMQAVFVRAQVVNVMPEVE